MLIRRVAVKHLAHDLLVGVRPVSLVKDIRRSAREKNHSVGLKRKSVRYRQFFGGFPSTFGINA